MTSGISRGNRGTRNIPSASSMSRTIVTKGNDTLLNWINDEIKALGKENFFHKDYG